MIEKPQENSHPPRSLWSDHKNSQTALGLFQPPVMYRVRSTSCENYWSLWSLSWRRDLETKLIETQRFQACTVKKSRPCRGTFARANQADRCMNLLHCAQRSTPWLLDTRGCERKVECFSLFERYVTLPVGWLHSSNLLAVSADVCCVLRNLTTSSFGKRKKRFR